MTVRLSGSTRAKVKEETEFSTGALIY
jgi:hypothetical protein